MSYISFTILTSDTAELRSRMMAYGFIKEETINGKVTLVPAKEGVEWVRVPNPIIVTPAVGTPFEIGYVPPVMDARKVFLVKIAHKALFDETKDDVQTNPDGSLKSILLRTKLGKWVAANSTAATVDGMPARKVGLKFWLVHGANGRLGVWQ